jgi:hypothetical protein
MEKLKGTEFLSQELTTQLGRGNFNSKLRIERF